MLEIGAKEVDEGADASVTGRVPVAIGVRLGS